MTVETQKVVENTMAAKVKAKVAGVDIMILKVYPMAVKRKSTTATGILSKS